MNVLRVFAAFFLLCSTVFAQTSFDEHFALASRGKLGPRESAFAKQCGVDRSTSVVTYGRSLDEDWTFQRVPDVGKGRGDAQMDYLGNAELWTIAGKPRLLNVWYMIMDIGSSSNEMFCFDASGHTVRQETLISSEPVDGGGVAWRHLRVRSFSEANKPLVLTKTFLSKSGGPIPAPKLSKDDLVRADAGATPEMATDMIAKLSRKGN